MTITEINNNHLPINIVRLFNSFLNKKLNHENDYFDYSSSPEFFKRSSYSSLPKEILTDRDFALFFLIKILETPENDPFITGRLEREHRAEEFCHAIKKTNKQSSKCETKNLFENTEFVLKVSKLYPLLFIYADNKIKSDPYIILKVCNFSKSAHETERILKHINKSLWKDDSFKNSASSNRLLSYIFSCLLIKQFFE